MASEKDGISKEDSSSITLNNKNLSAVAALLFANTPTDDLNGYQPEELTRAAELAADALLTQSEGETVIRVENGALTRRQSPICVVTLVNDNKPFLLDSIMSVINEHGLRIYLVSHPVIDVERQSKPGEVIFRRNIGMQNARIRRVSLIQFHLQQLSDIEVKALTASIELTLNQVNSAVRDWKPMIEELRQVKLSYQLTPLKERRGDAERVIEFLDWLVDNNFTFLGMRQYDFDKNNKPENAFRPHGVELGILTDASIHILADPKFQSVPQDVLAFMESNEFLIVTKANARSRIHRTGWLDYIGIKLFNNYGALTGELRIVGLFTSTAYTSSVLKIPYLKPKVEAIIERLGFNTTDHSGKALINILETYPRDELFRTDVDTLTENSRLILELGERPRVRVLTHADPFGRFVSVLAYIPRDRYDTEKSEKIGQYLTERFNGTFYDCHPLFLSDALTRLYYVIHRQAKDSAPSIPRSDLERQITIIVRNWQDSVFSASQKLDIGSDQTKLAANFPDSYRNLFSVENALEDAGHILDLDSKHPIFVQFRHYPDVGMHSVSLKLFHRGDELVLSERVPLLENMGFRVIAEQTLELPDGHDGKAYLHDMQLENAFGGKIDLSDNGALLAEAFAAIWSEDADDDAFNGLIQSARLNWREVVILRSYGRYLQQTGIPYNQARLAQTLNSYPNIARAIYALFQLKFDPARQIVDSRKEEQQLQENIEIELQTVPSLDDDLILRRFRNLVAATVRTNAFTPQQNGHPPRIIAIKLEPRAVDGLPEPRPYREIFVYGPEVEGVHLRFGPVARGGIRWSDRALDYRTEILGLVKAQQVKNAVIVPVGSKGGFYPHRLPQSADRAVVIEAARQAYIAYISAMLSITDNLVNGEIRPPQGVVRHDGDDPYFVVAADKGTATFSDTANAISQGNHFWLDDAFASGGTDGYDHKIMGITAKGAWEAVKRHFRELFNRDIQQQPFSVVGVGDMSGDVFGNGMLLSKQIHLIAAFDHRDIFIDPKPNPEVSFNERLRLFNQSRSSWQDYDRSKISQGGGVYSRNQKTITLSPEAANAIGLEKLTGTPFEIISAILKADVDLLWFGGIGTYVRATTETDAQVGDRANDPLRVTGAELRAKVVGEGANLGMTQRARVEYSIAGGRCDTDAIDNSAGVNCSDVEVNIKIALAAAMHSGKLTRDNRNILLKKMTPDVSDLVLRNNYLQPLTLSLAQKRSVIDLPYQIRFMNDLERRKLLDRRVEILPDNHTLAERVSHGLGLTRPELSVVMAYAKLTLQAEITADDLSEDRYFDQTLIGYFPALMQEDFRDEILGHQLNRDIIATILANDAVNRGGPTFVHRLQDKTGRTPAQVVKAYVAARDGFAVDKIYEQIDALDNLLAGDTQNELYAAVTNMLFVTTSWILRNVDAAVSLTDLVEAMINARNTIEKQLDQLMPDYMREILTAKKASYVALDVPEALSQKLALFDVATIIPDIGLIANDTSADLVKTAEIYFSLVEMFRINRIEEASNAIPVIDYYDGMAVALANDSIAESVRLLVTGVIKNYGDHKSPVDAWLQAQGKIVEDMRKQMNTLIEGDLNISRFTVAAGMMANLAKAIV